MVTAVAPQAEFQELSPTTYRVDITVPPENFRTKLDAQYRELAASASIPGFRPGKAPRNILNRHFGWPNILKHTIEEVVEETFWPLVQKRELTVIGKPRIDTGKYEDGTDFNYTAVVEVTPVVPSIDYKAFKTYLPSREITDKMVDDEIRNLSIRMGVPKEINDRPASKGDFVFIELSGEVPDVLVDTLDGENPWKYRASDVMVELGAGKAIPGLEDELAGMEVEEIKDFEIVLPDDFGDPRVRGKRMIAKARIKSIKEIDRAEIDDEFIKVRMGQGIENLDALKERIREEIQSSVTSADDQAKYDQIEAQLSTMFDFPLPEGLVRMEFSNVLDKALVQLKENGIDLDDLMDEKNEKGILIRKKVRYQAQRFVRMNLLLHEISRRESIKVAGEEVMNFIAMLAYRSGLGEKEVRQWVQDEEFIQATRDDILKKKVIHFLIDKVEAERVEPEKYEKLMEESRTHAENMEKRYVESSDDPLVHFKDDYLPEPSELLKTAGADNEIKPDREVGDGSGEEEIT